MNNYHPVVEILVERYGMSPDSLEPLHEQMLAYRENTDGVKEALIKHKVTSEAVFQQALASYYELEYRENFNDFPVVREFTEFIPIRYAKRNIFFPLKKERNKLEVAIENPALSQPLDDLARHFKCHIEPILSHKQAVLDLINRAYDESSVSTEEAVDQLDSEETYENILAVEEPEDLLDATDEEPIKRLVNSLLWQAAKEEASDVHIDPTPRDSVVRYRIDGVLQQVTVFPRLVHVTVVNRVKVMSRLDIAQKGLPQDGRSMVLIAGRKIDIRVSTAPTVHGEKIVMRLLYQDEKLMHLRQLGLAKYIQNPYENMVHSSGGIILVTGPTGSGKTTTLYASLAEIDNEAHNVITIEDPVEFIHKDKKSIVSQREVGKQTKTFAGALRAALREDPDVILVGEMRDLETISLALTAAETGHLVFGTLHTSGAPNTINRIVDAFPAEQQEQIRAQISESLKMVVTQKLFRTKNGQGRVGAFEVMKVTAPIRNLMREAKIHQIPSIMQTSAREGMITMSKSIEDLVKSGTIDQNAAKEN